MIILYFIFSIHAFEIDFDEVKKTYEKNKSYFHSNTIKEVYKDAVDIFEDRYLKAQDLYQNRDEVTKDIMDEIISSSELGVYYDKYYFMKPDSYFMRRYSRYKSVNSSNVLLNEIKYDVTEGFYFIRNNYRNIPYLRRIDNNLRNSIDRLKRLDVHR